MKKIIIFIILLFSVFTFAKGSKGIYSCKVSQSCELSDYTGDYTKNCQKYNDDRGFQIYWEYAYDEFGNLLFCDKPAWVEGEKICTKIISQNMAKNSYGIDVLIIKGEYVDYVFGIDNQSYNYLNIIYRPKTLNAKKFSHTLCQPLYLD